MTGTRRAPAALQPVREQCAADAQEPTPRHTAPVTDSDAHDSAALARLCRYGARPPFALDRIRIDDTGRVRYRLKRRTRSGATELCFDPADFLARLATLIPPPRTHSVRYHGVFAPNHRWRSRIVPQVMATTATPTADVAVANGSPAARPIAASALARRLNWAELLRRVFAVDVTTCARCGGRLRVLAFFTESPLSRRILDHLGLPSTAPTIMPARAPPQSALWT